MTEDVTSYVQNELALCYESIGRKASDALPFVAASIQDAIHFETAEQVHEVFKRAKDIESIPTQKTLKECLKNYSEEVLKYVRRDTDAGQIEYKDRRSAWLPKNPLMQQVNLREAIKNYCIAVGGDMYARYCETHRTKFKYVDKKRVVEWENADAAEAFDRPIVEYLMYLYPKYWRGISMAKGFPEDGQLDLGLIPPRIEEFQTMLKAEGVIK